MSSLDLRGETCVVRNSKYMSKKDKTRGGVVYETPQEQRKGVNW